MTISEIKTAITAALMEDDQVNYWAGMCSEDKEKLAIAVQRGSMTIGDASESIRLDALFAVDGF